MNSRILLVVFLVAVRASQAGVPVLPDTGLVLQARGVLTSGVQRLDVQLVNASSRQRANLSVRLVLEGDSTGLAGLVLRPALVGHSAASGTMDLPSIGSVGLDSAVRGTFEVGSCATTCRASWDLSLGNVRLAPVEAVRLQWLAGTSSMRYAPVAMLSHAPAVTDWSFQGLSLDAEDDDPRFESGSLPPATHVQVFEGGTRVWGIAPGEPEPVFPSPWARDRRVHAWSPIANRRPDSLGRRIRDSLNVLLPRVLVNQAGYRLVDVKAGSARFMGMGASGSTFQVVDASGAVVATGNMHDLGVRDSATLKVVAETWSAAVEYTFASAALDGDLSEGFLPSSLAQGGPYRVVVGADTSASFRVDDRIYSWLRDVELRYFGAQRSGSTDSWLRGTSFPGDPAPGGWYDCGDHLKEAQPQGAAMAILAVLAAAHPERDDDLVGSNHDDPNPDGVPDLLRELKQGVDYVLDSWDRNGSSPTTLVTSVGDYGADHGSWMPSEWQSLVQDGEVGGPPDRVGRVELGANVAGDFAAALAVFSRLWKGRDPNRAAHALEVAKALYLHAKADPDHVVSSHSWTGAFFTEANLALAATTLLWATGDTAFLTDLVRDPALAPSGNASPFLYSKYPGGWMARRNPPMHKGAWPMDWANRQPLALYAFGRLVLADASGAASMGVRSEAERTAFLQALLATFTDNLHNVSEGATGVSMPGTSVGEAAKSIGADPVWGTMAQGADWGAAGYQSGNAAELLLFAELLDLAEGSALPDWSSADLRGKADSLRTMGIRILDHILGANPWGLSYVLGVGERNPQHPNHREGNPELRTVRIDYPYTTPDGALVGGMTASSRGRTYVDQARLYTTSEPCLTGSAHLLIPATLLSVASRVGPVASRRVSASRLSIAVRGGNDVVVRWAGASGPLDIRLLDASGRQIARIDRFESAGSARFASPSARGVLFVQVGDGTAVRDAILPRP
ncbi:MAG: glycoside hydrolase family 9 protein [Fibrobacteria bacterium]|nr:glycoside hydrolase family 9 protein [Fibrobacteria bacterium]